MQLPDLRRIAMLSVHTSPVEQPGTGDAGGMNVYVVELATRLAQLGVEVEIFTRATEAGSAEVVQYAPGVQVRHVLAGPLQGLSKDDLPGQLCAFAAGLMRTEARRPANWYDLVHSHYWLSGQVGWLVADRWNVPLVHSMHTMAKVKNAYLAEGDHPEPPIRVIGEEQVVTEADRLIASTGQERSELLELYQARPDRVTVIAPGVDLDVFRPGDRDADRAALGLRPDAVVLLFVGRIQPLKAPDVLVRAAAYLLRDDPTLVDRLAVVVVGGPSGSGLEHPEDLADLARSLGLTQHSDRADIVRFVPPQGRAELARWYRAADVAVVPSYNESFGLVAVEAQACGTPVVAADVGGLPTAVADGVSGVLVDGHDPRTWSCELGSLINDEPRRARLARGAVAHAQTFGWDACVQAHLQTYRLARSERLARLM